VEAVGGWELISGISRGDLEPAAEGRTADTQKAETLVAVTWHLQEK